MYLIASWLDLNRLESYPSTTYFMATLVARFALSTVRMASRYRIELG